MTATAPSAKCTRSQLALHLAFELGRQHWKLSFGTGLDRLLHRYHVLNIKGRSYRLRDLERVLQDGEPSAPKTRR